MSPDLAAAMQAWAEALNAWRDGVDVATHALLGADEEGAPDRALPHEACAAQLKARVDRARQHAQALARQELAR